MKINSHYSKTKFLNPLIVAGSFLVMMLLPIQTFGAKDAIRVGDFSSSLPGSILPEHWEPLTFEKITAHTQYTVVEDTHTSVIQAVSEQSASGLIRKIRIDPELYPLIKWRWKITNIYKNGDVTQKKGDDYPARIYIAFEYDPEDVGFFEKVKFYAIKLIYGEYPPIAAINYIWANKAPIGAIVENPYTGRVKMVVVESDGKKLNAWMEEERNIYNDYINAFGKNPPLISGVAIMTDSDNTGESAVSFYGDILFESKQ
jgi:hypothetical protein